MAEIKPNVIVMMTDQQKATASHLWGSPFCETPSLERMATEGVLYDNAFTPHPLCVPARVSLWTGQYPHMHGSRRNETWMAPDALHAFKIWKAQGFHCGLIGKNHCFNSLDDLGLFDTWLEISHGGLPDVTFLKGMEWYRSREGINAAHKLRRTMTPQSPHFSWAVSDFPLEDYGTGLIAGQTVRFLEKHREDPFALWVSFPDPHEPWVVPQKYFDMFPPDVVQLPICREGEFEEGSGAPERNRILYQMLGMEGDNLDDIYGLLAAYYGMVRFIDDGVGQILDALDNLGMRENTIVVFCADHGDFAGEHRMQCKGGAFYDALTHVPLIISWPGHIPQGASSDAMVSLVDIVPTLFTLQGLPVPPSMAEPGLPVAIDAPQREAAFSEYGAGGPPFTTADLEAMPQPFGRKTLIASLHWREAEGRRKMVRTRRWKYVHDPMGDDIDELYDLQKDPWELVNVAGDPAHKGVICDLQRRLADWSIRTEDSPPVPLPDPDTHW